MEIGDDKLETFKLNTQTKMVDLEPWRPSKFVVNMPISSMVCCKKTTIHVGMDYVIFFICLINYNLILLHMVYFFIDWNILDDYIYYFVFFITIF
jgi:hypothetical protein